MRVTSGTEVMGVTLTPARGRDVFMPFSPRERTKPYLAGVLFSVSLRPRGLHSSDRQRHKRKAAHCTGWRSRKFPHVGRFIAEAAACAPRAMVGLPHPTLVQRLEIGHRQSSCGGSRSGSDAMKGSWVPALAGMTTVAMTTFAASNQPPCRSVAGARPIGSPSPPWSARGRQGSRAPATERRRDSRGRCDATHRRR
jgi:hypothetical protein